MRILGPLTALAFVLGLPGGAIAQWTNTGGGDHDKTDWTITNGTQIAGVHTGVVVLTIPAGATVTIAPYDGAAFGRVEIQCEDAVIDGDLMGTAAGFRGGNVINPPYDGENATQGGKSGSVFATNGGGGGGGGHGGPGGKGAVNGIGAGPGGGQAGAAGSFTALMGGGGGSGAAIPDGFSTAPIGGNGGAGIKIIADPGSITVNGSIIVNGSDGQPEPTIGFSAGGGGAGGGIVLMSTCGAVINSGILGADGGAGGSSILSAQDDGGGGGGAGGRIGLFGFSAVTLGTATAAGGTGGTSGSSNLPGTNGSLGTLTTGTLTCGGPEITCGDGIDNDNDLVSDCADSDCTGISPCTGGGGGGGGGTGPGPGGPLLPGGEGGASGFLPFSCFASGPTASPRGTLLLLAVLALLAMGTALRRFRTGSALAPHRKSAAR